MENTDGHFSRYNNSKNVYVFMIYHLLSRPVPSHPIPSAIDFNLHMVELNYIFLSAVPGGR